MAAPKTWLNLDEAIDLVLRATRPAGLATEVGVRAGTAVSKLHQGRTIGRETRAKWQDLAGGNPRDAVDNAFDAQRHAEWNRQMADELGPGYARFIAEAYETTHRGRPAANAMDRYNNEVGVRSVELGIPYTLDDLQLAPGVPAKNAERWKRR